jgi:two-component system, chemotaxis family, chemotaxis protein CheY
MAAPGGSYGRGRAKGGPGAHNSRQAGEEMAFNILVADDSETMRAVIKKTVTMSGVPVGTFHEAANGREALAVLEQNWVDVILSDINMPEMGGMELLKVVSEDADLCRIPLIFITTEGSEARQDEARRLGVAGYVKKPFQPQDIKAILYEVLEKAYENRMQDIPENDAGEDMDF